jgi:acyl-coenzyme A thioesterase PaaI-like protein
MSNTENSDILPKLQERLPPFSKLLDIKFLSAAPERLTAEMVVREELCTTPAILHGGALDGFRGYAWGLCDGYQFGSWVQHNDH